jgi:hypothetical protein
MLTTRDGVIQWLTDQKEHIWSSKPEDVNLRGDHAWFCDIDSEDMQSGMSVHRISNGRGPIVGL